MNRSIISSLLKNQKGMGIIEVLIAAGLLAIVTLGVSALVVNMQVEQKRIQIRSTVNDIKNRYNSLIVDNKAWTATISNNPGMNCLSSNLGCPAGVNTFDLYLPGSPTPFRSIAANEGFTESGTPCTGFIAPPGVAPAGARLGTGTDACPIAYSLLWEPVQPGKQNSMVRITARLVYNGLTSNKFQASVETSYRSSATPWPLYDTSVTNLPLARYDIQIVRNSTSVGRQFTVAQDGAAGGAPGGSEGGNCGTAIDTVRPLNVPEDPSTLITLAGNTFSFNEAGLFKCSITAVAFAVNAFQPSVTKNGVKVATGNGFSGRWSQVSANFDTTITVLASEITTAGNAQYGMTQNCQTLPSQGGVVALNPTFAIDNFGLGMPTAPYTSAPRYASITCVKMDD